MNKKREGFTLIELLVVVLIIGILSAVALPQYTKAVEKSRASEARANVKAMYDAVDMLYLSGGGTANNWDLTFDQLDITFTGESGGGNTSSLSTKNFNYNLYGGWCPNGTSHAVRASRLNSSSFYYEISYCRETGLRCGDNGNGECKSIGFHKTSNTCLSGGSTGGICFTE